MRPVALNQPAPVEIQSQDVRGTAVNIIGLFWQGKWIIAAATVLGILLGLSYIFYGTQKAYTSRATLVLENRESSVVDFEDVVSNISGDKASINTEVEVMRSRELAGRIVDALRLMDDPEFNSRLRPPRQISLIALRQLIDSDYTPPAPPKPHQVRDATVDALLKALKVTNIRDSYVFILEIETDSAEKSARIVNAMAEAYVDEQLDVKFQATEKATGWLSARVADLKAELETAEGAVKDFRTSMEALNTEALDALNRQLKTFRERRSTAESAIIDLDARLVDLIAARTAGDPERMALVADDAVLTRIAQQVASGRVGRVAFDKRYEDIVERARVDRTRQARQIEGLEASLSEIESSVEAQSQDLVKLGQLEREAEASRLIYEYFLSRLKETSVQQGIQQADSRVMSRGVEPIAPSKPRVGLILMLSAMVGFMGGASLVLARDIMRTGFQSAEELEAATGISVIGQIPKAPTARRRKVLQYLIERPDSMMAEAVRNMRTSLLMSNLDNPPKVIMMTSSVPGEGKTTLSLSLATNLAGMGKKVLAIEGDIRRRTFSEYFDLGNQPGLLSAVAGERDLSELIVPHQELGLDLLIGEKSRLNAADFFSSEAFKTFMQALRAEYDFIIIDTPPVLVVPDARVIARSADAVVFVVRWNHTGRVPVRGSLDSFSTINVPVSGVCLSQIEPRGGRYSYYGGYGGYGGSKYYDRRD